MATTTMITEDYSFNTILEDMNDVEFSNIDTSFLMSLTEDSQVEDDQRLRTVIWSLEEEILNQNSLSETNSEGYQFSDVGQMESFCTSPDHDLYFEGIDMEMMNYSSFHFEDNVEDMVEFGELRDYSSQVCCGIAMEEDDYSGLWQ